MRPTSGPKPASFSRFSIRPRFRASRSRTSFARRGSRCTRTTCRPRNSARLIFEQLDVLGHGLRRFSSRYVNDGFSGGEKKRLEMLQLAMLGPKYAILDETDSASTSTRCARSASRSTRCAQSERGKETGFLIITHYPRILQYITPDRVHIMMDGRIVKIGRAGTRERDRTRRLRSRFAKRSPRVPR